MIERIKTQGNNEKGAQPEDKIKKRKNIILQLHFNYFEETAQLSNYNPLTWLQLKSTACNTDKLPDPEQLMNESYEECLVKF